jgi:protein gp37
VAGIPGHHFENGFDVTLRPERVDQPLRWKRPKRIFVNSMSDLFHDRVPDEFIARVFAVMALAPQHTFQVLTKRHGRMRSLLASGEKWRELVREAAAWAVDLDVPVSADRFTELRRWASTEGHWKWDCGGSPEVEPPPNVWLGVSAENQKWFDIRVPALLATPAAVRFVSCEPLLGWIDMAFDHECGDPPHSYCPPVPDWVIVGGESGPGGRPMELQWAREIVKQCRWSGIAPFVKQLGAVLGRELAAGPMGADWRMWPEDLKVREFPRPAPRAAASGQISTGQPVRTASSQRPEDSLY